MLKKKVNVVLVVAMLLSFIVMLYGAYVVYRYDRNIKETLLIVENIIDDEIVSVSDKVDDVKEDTLIYKKKDDYSAAIGIITFENGKKVAIYNSSDEDYMMIGAIKISNGAILNESGNSVMLSHRDGCFGILKDVSVGDVIEVKTSASIEKYKVIDVYDTEKDDPIPYEDSDDTRITLITCYPFVYLGDAPKRYVVVAELV